MNSFLHGIALASALVATAICAPSADGADVPKPRKQAEFEAATRLQIFLDRAEFAPGKIDGRYGEFTMKALALYRQSRGGDTRASLPSIAEGKGGKQTAVAPNIDDLNLAGIDPVFTTYTVTESDLRTIGEVPDSVPEQAKLKSLPYRDAAEAMAEKFHLDVDFLAELNPGRIKSIKAGDTLVVPNVEPFEVGAVEDLKPGGEISRRAAANDSDGETGETKPEPGRKTKEPPVTVTVQIDTQTNMLSVREGSKLVAAYPVTVGSDATLSPVGEWKVRGMEKMPTFRHDEAMLKAGVRSSKFHVLPAGPNNPVGVLWIQLNKKGIGIHGTNDPDRIGRSASHGCVRLANWDVVRLAGKVKASTPVVIQ